MHSIIIYILFIHFHFYSLFVYYYLCHYYYYYYYFYFLFLFLFYLFTYLIENCWNCLDLKDAYDPLCWRTKLYNLVSPSSLPLILKSCFILLFPLVSFSFLLIFLLLFYSVLHEEHRNFSRRIRGTKVLLGRNLHALSHMGGMTQRLPLKKNDTCELPLKNDPHTRL